ncbi:MAG: hypothetical protein WC884_01995 [Candidatus Paceibacterota bacterium]
MTRFILPIILIGITLSLFVMFVNPVYNDISILRKEVVSYNEALDNSKMLESERDKLTAQYNSINVDNLIKLQKFLPENVDNIRLILEIEQIALPYGMVLKDVKYNTSDADTTSNKTGSIQGGEIVKPGNKDYGIFNLEFSTSGTYNNFINFTKDIESNLRMVDIASVVFSSDANINSNTKISSSEIYKYNFKIKTYYLKN